MKELTLHEAAQQFHDAVSKIDFSAIPGAYDTIPFAALETALKGKPEDVGRIGGKL